MTPSSMSIVSRIQQERMDRYKSLIAMAGSKEEEKALYKAYEVSRLIFIKDEDIMERNSWLIRNEK